MTRALAVTLLVLLSVTGCASATAGVGGRPHPQQVPAGQIVFQVTAGGGLEPYDLALARRPALTVYGDGRTLSLMAGRTVSGAPTGLSTGTIPRDRLRQLTADAGRSGLFGGASFGMPHVTDLGSTGVLFRPGADAARQASAYALEYRTGDGQVSATQRVNRVLLRHLIDELTSSVRPGTEYRPSRIDVSEPTADPGIRSGTRVWPGPSLDDGLLPHRHLDARCGVLDGADARRVYRAARGGSGTAWTVGGRVRHLVVRALLPGERGCTP